MPWSKAEGTLTALIIFAFLQAVSQKEAARDLCLGKGLGEHPNAAEMGSDEEQLL